MIPVLDLENLSVDLPLGGFLSLSDRRYRVAAGARRAPTAAVPAE